MRDNLGNADREKKQDMQGKPVHGFFYHLFGILKAAALIIIFLIAASAAWSGSLFTNLGKFN